MKKSNKKGFTLAELLIVVAIIAVLVAIAIPVFTAQLEKSREAVDAANIRAAYAEISADAITDSLKTDGYTVTLKQETTGWANKFDLPSNLVAPTDAAEPSKGAVAHLTWNATSGQVNIDIKLPAKLS